jgi:amino acid permease
MNTQRQTFKYLVSAFVKGCNITLPYYSSNIQFMFSTQAYKIQNQLVNNSPKKLVFSIHKQISPLLCCMPNILTAESCVYLKKTNSWKHSFAQYLTTIPFVNLATVTDLQITGTVTIFPSNNKFR